VPKLNDIYTEYGCNKGELVVIMDGINIYHDKMKARYKDSLGGIFPMLCVEDNLDSLHYLKKDFPGAAPTYGLVSPDKEILHSSRSFSDFSAALEALNLKKQPELCDSVTPTITSKHINGNSQGLSIHSVCKDRIIFSVMQKSRYTITLFDIAGKQITLINNSMFTQGLHEIRWNNNPLSAGIYLVQIRGYEFNSTNKFVLIK
jgi:hypothetical protein